MYAVVALGLVGYYKNPTNFFILLFTRNFASNAFDIVLEDVTQQRTVENAPVVDENGLFVVMRMMRTQRTQHIRVDCGSHAAKKDTKINEYSLPMYTER